RVKGEQPVAARGHWAAQDGWPAMGRPSLLSGRPGGPMERDGEDRSDGTGVDAHRESRPEAGQSYADAGITNGAARRRWAGPGMASPGWKVRGMADEQLLDRPMPVEPVPRAPELGAFTHTDAWRVLRIQGEFVSGINALAEVGAAVSIFGSARFGESHP